jgi:hypothetical protein
VEDLKDPRHIFLDGFKDLFLSLKKETYNVIKKMPGWVGGSQEAWPARPEEGVGEEESEGEVEIDQLPDDLETFQPEQEDYQEFLQWIDQKHPDQKTKLREMTEACKKLNRENLESAQSIVYGIYQLFSSKRSAKVTGKMVQEYLRSQFQALPNKYSSKGWKGFALACTQLFTPIVDALQEGSSGPALPLAVVPFKPKAK